MENLFNPEDDYDYNPDYESYEPKVSRNTKDRLFRFIFGNEKHKDWTLSLYNAIHGTSYENPDDITITTMEDVVYLSMRNDVSFLISDTMSFYEQLSTFNPNLPIRMLIYAGLVYNAFMEKNKLNKYSPALKRLPTPKLVCFYNGTEDKEDRSYLRLSDAFGKDLDTDIEVNVLMLNINYGRNKGLLGSCKPLAEYSLFVDSVRKYSKGYIDKGEAVRRAIKDLPSDSALKKFLKAHEAEVKEMCLTEYNEKEERELLRQEALDIGRAEGLNSYDQLLRELISQNRIDDIKRASEDADYRSRLFLEFGI